VSWAGEDAALRKARYLARFMSWRLGRQVALPRGNDDALNAHWIHEPLRWADDGTAVTVAE